MLPHHQTLPTPPSADMMQQVNGGIAILIQTGHGHGTNLIANGTVSIAVLDPMDVNPATASSDSNTIALSPGYDAADYALHIHHELGHIEAGHDPLNVPLGAHIDMYILDYLYALRLQCCPPFHTINSGTLAGIEDMLKKMIWLHNLRYPETPRPAFNAPTCADVICGPP